MAQERISVAENPNYSRFNIKTLKRIASAFNVALIVRFVPFGELVNWELNISSETLAPPSFDEDPYFKEIPKQQTVDYSQLIPPIYADVGSGGIVLGGEGVVNFINPSQDTQHLHPSREKPEDELAKRREAKQRQMRGQLSEHLTGRQVNEIAIG
jgi:hypothetical protein